MLHTRMLLLKRHIPFLSALAVFSLALFVRIIYNKVVGAHYVPRPDSSFYNGIAEQFIQKACFCYYKGIETTNRAPLWPMIMAVIYSFTGAHNEYARLFLCFVGSGTCVLLFLFARDNFGLGYGVLAGLAAALYPQLFIYDGFLYTESLFIFLTVAFSYALYRLYIRLRGKQTLRQNLPLCLLCAFLLAASALTRPNGLLFAALLIPWALLLCLTRTLPWRQTFLQIFTVIGVALLLVLPWTVRNYIVTKGAFIPVASGDGVVLLGVYNDKMNDPKSGLFYGTWIRPDFVAFNVTQKYDRSPCTAVCEVARDDEYKAVAQHWISTHLSSMPALFRQHFYNLWRPATKEADLPAERYPSELATFIKRQQQSIPPWVFAFAFLGFLLTIFRWKDQLFIYLLFLLIISQALYFYGIPRFRAPLEPFLLYFAVGSLYAVVFILFRLVKGRKSWVKHS